MGLNICNVTISVIKATKHPELFPQHVKLSGFAQILNVALQLSQIIVFIFKKDTKKTKKQKQAYWVLKILYCLKKKAKINQLQLIQFYALFAFNIYYKIFLF